MPEHRRFRPTEAVLTEAPHHVLERYNHARTYTNGPFSMAADFQPVSLPNVDRTQVMVEDVQHMVVTNEERMQRLVRLGTSEWHFITYDFIRAEEDGIELQARDFAKFRAFFNTSGDPNDAIVRVYQLLGQLAPHTILSYEYLEGLFQKFPVPRRAVVFAEAHGLLSRYKMEGYNPPKGRIVHNYGYYEDPSIGLMTDPRLFPIISSDSYRNGWDNDGGVRKKPKPPGPPAPRGGVLLELPKREERELEEVVIRR